MSKISEKQKNILIDFVKSNKNLVSGKFTSTFTYKDAEAQWTELSNVLNSIPGPTKPWKSWRKTWQDMRSRTKTKYASNKRNLMATGGGPFVEEVISKIDEDIIDIIKPVCLNGHEEVQESNVTIVFDANEQGQTLKEATNIDETVTNIEKTTPKDKPGKYCVTRTLAKRGGINLRRTEKAAMEYEKMLKKKLEIKENYYNKKLELLQEKNLILKENGRALNKITNLLENFVGNVI